MSEPSLEKLNALSEMSLLFVRRSILPVATSRRYRSPLLPSSVMFRSYRSSGVALKPIHLPSSDTVTRETLYAASLVSRFSARETRSSAQRCTRGMIWLRIMTPNFAAVRRCSSITTVSGARK